MRISTLSSTSPSEIMSAESVPSQQSIVSEATDIAHPTDAIRSELPSPASENRNQLSPAFIQVERLVWWILVSLCGVVSLIAWLVVGFFVRESFDGFQWLGLIGIVVLVATGLWASFFLPSRTYETTTWVVSDLGIEIRKGIWWQHRIFVPRERIQHADVNQGPLMRVYGLATLVINTGGTHEPSIELPGLSHATAISVRDSLVKRSSTRLA